MKNENLKSSSITYFSGWDVALHNYDVFEIESIKQLVNSSREQILPQLAKIREEYTGYFPLTLMNSHNRNF
jgi:hypothetical protein